MKKILILIAFSLIAPSAMAVDMTDDQKTFYVIGFIVGKQTEIFNLTAPEVEFVKKGLADSALGKKPAVEPEAWTPKVQQMVASRGVKIAEKAAAAGKAFADKAAREKGAVKTASGLVYLPLKEGTGTNPASTDIVKVHYRGTLPDGKEFDSSYKRGEPVEFPLNGVIKCWTEGVQKMKVGGKAKLTCPPEIAYGSKGAGAAIPPNATLSFEVELLAVTPAPAPAAAAPAPKQPDPAETKAMYKAMALQTLREIPKDVLKEVLEEAQKNMAEDTSSK